LPAKTQHSCRRTGPSSKLLQDLCRHAASVPVRQPASGRRRPVAACELGRHNAQLWEPGKNGVAIIESTANKRHDQTQTGGHLAENASDGFHATKMKITNTSYLADLFPHRQLTVQDDAYVANAGGGTNNFIPDMQCEVNVLHSVHSMPDAPVVMSGMNPYLSVVGTLSCQRISAVDR
jgi:hypothetical protein